jgi:hypothetical protein
MKSEARTGFLVMLAFGCTPAFASIISSSGAGSITSAVGGVSTGTVAFGPSPALLAAGGPAGSPVAFMAMTWNNTPSVFLANDSAFGPSPSGQSYTFALVGSSGPVEIKGVFDVNYDLGIGGLASMAVAPLEYPIFWIGGSNSFDASVVYSDSISGTLGTLSLHFAPPTGSGDSIFAPLPIVGGPGFTLPALPAFDTLHLTGSFDLKSDALGVFPSTEIKVLGADVPEPSTTLLVAAAIWAVALVQRAERLKRV